MPTRTAPIVTEQIYHVFNRSVGNITLFTQVRDYSRFYDTVDYYRFVDPPVRFSFYTRSNLVLRKSLLETLYSSKTMVSILAYAFMPNHYHFVLKQTSELGISTFMRRLQNSYAKYFNIKYKRFGSLFQSLFKCIRIENDDQLLHVVRYIHLNPVTAYQLKSIRDLESYKWTSYPMYLKDSAQTFADTLPVLSHFKMRTSFQSFTCDQVGYQRTLAEIRHLGVVPDV